MSANKNKPHHGSCWGTRNACEKSVQAMAHNVNSANIYKCALINGVCIEARYDMSN